MGMHGYYAAEWSVTANASRGQEPMRQVGWFQHSKIAIFQLTS